MPIGLMIMLLLLLLLPLMLLLLLMMMRMVIVLAITKQSSHRLYLQPFELLPKHLILP